jgi:hypothetical protein
MGMDVVLVVVMTRGGGEGTVDYEKVYFMEMTHGNQLQGTS